ncbi:MAG: ATP-binding protein [Oscillospiraceae bacterium]|jgi:DNA replication protein DnaC|nr:ATP-binding protein [Oscillospiraceae bacterium]
MAFDSKVLQRALARYDAEKTERRIRFEREREEIFAAIPRARSLDQKIRRAVIDAAAAIHHSEHLARDIDNIAAENLGLQRELAAALKNGGRDPNALDERPGCEICGDRGFAHGNMCECLSAIYRDEQLKTLGEAIDIEFCRFGNFSLSLYPANSRAIMERVFQLCKDYAENFTLGSRNLYLYGGPGLGKSFIGGCIAREVTERGYSVIYTTAVKFCEISEKSKFARNAVTDEQDDAARRFFSGDLLILDDLGTEMRTQFTISSIYDVINSRIAASLPTIITSNYAPNQLGAAYSPQIESRLSYEYIPCPFAGEDIRKIKRGR